MYPNIDKSVVNESIVKNFNNVIDVIYNPLETKLMRLANENGKNAYDGLTMLIMQGLKAEEIWNNFKIKKEDINRVSEIFKKEI